MSYKLPGVDDYEKYRYREVKLNNKDEYIIQRSAYNTSYRPFDPPVLPTMTRRHSSLSIRPPTRH
jgi:hypothetical protein